MASDPTYSQVSAELRNPTNGSWWMVQVPPTKTRAAALRESHQRQLVDGSGPAYQDASCCPSGIPPTAVGGWFRSSLPRRELLPLRNPTNGSWWMVQIRPTKTRAVAPQESHQRQLVDSSDPTLRPRRLSQYSLPVYLTPFTSLNWAYQLHYTLCFRTHRRRSLFASTLDNLTELLNEICGRHDYHLLECQPHADHLRSLISLQPAHSIARVTQIIKTNSSRELPFIKPVWARGYLARSVGRVRIDAVRQYLDQQAKHHGYDSRILPPVFRFRATQPTELRSAHASFELNHHLVLATSQRKGIFTSTSGQALSDYWLKVAAARDFAVDQVSFVPDHVHLIVRILPKMSIEECTLLLMNNGQHFIGKTYPHLYVEAGIDQLWQASAYAGTCGAYTTALVKSWLRTF